MGWSLLSSSVTYTPLGANPPWVLHFDLSARFHEGDCDAGCTALAELLGWDKDLQALIDSKGKLLCTGPLGWKHPKLRTNPIEVAKKESFYLQCILFANTIYDYI